MNASQTLSKRLSNSGITVDITYCRARQRYYGWATICNGQEIYLSNVPRDLEAAELWIVRIVLENAV
jgi:hypothetical protein